MSLFCIWRNWIRSVFRLLFRRGSEKRDNDLYVETLTEYLLQRSPLRSLSLSKGRSSPLRSLSNPSLRSLSTSLLRSLSLSKGIPQGHYLASTSSATVPPMSKGIPQGHYLASTSSATVPPMSKGIPQSHGLVLRPALRQAQGPLSTRNAPSCSLRNSPLRSLSLSRSSSARLLPTGRKKGIPQKNLPMKGLWKGTVSSLTEAYTFLLNLPGVCLSRVECYMIADRLVYQVQINRQMEIIMREHTKGFDRWVCLTLLESKKPRLQIRLRLCEVETHELVSHYMTSSS